MQGGGDVTLSVVSLTSEDRECEQDISVRY